jgi:hypothetical protein
LPLSFEIECQNIDRAIVNKVYNKHTERNRYIFTDTNITTFREKLAEILSPDFINQYMVEIVDNSKSLTEIISNFNDVLYYSGNCCLKK